MDFSISDADRIQLDRMLQENNVEDTTNKIRELKHSKPIEDAIRLIEQMKHQYPRIYETNYERFEQMVQSRGGSWLWTYYTNIYNKLMKNQIDPNILYSMVTILRKIENQEIDQHEGSVMVGRILKEIYIDSAIKTDAKYHSSNKKKSKERKHTKQIKKLSWNDYKQTILQQENKDKSA